MRTKLPYGKGHNSLPFLAHVCIVAKLLDGSLGREVGLGPGDIVLDGHQDPNGKGHTTPTFLPMSIVAKLLDGSLYHLVRR